MNEFRPVVLWSVCLILLIGCCFPLPDRNLTRTVAETEIVGVWRLTDESLELLQRDGFVADPDIDYTLALHADGVLQFDSVIDDFRSGTYQTIGGTWRLDHNSEGDSNIEKPNVLEMELRSPGSTHFRSLNFGEEEGQLILWNYYGDPDSWEFMEYERIDSP